MPVNMTGADGEWLEPQPLYVIRSATKTEYEAQSEKHKGWSDRPFYYEVSTD